MLRQPPIGSTGHLSCAVARMQTACTPHPAPRASISRSDASSESTCGKKRAREESLSRGPERHGQLWFDDGNVVLLADNVAFKVHRSLLSRHSTVFKDLFELSQPSAALDEQLDGVPLVKLHDSSHDLADLLDVIYNGPRYASSESETYNILK